MEVDLFAPWILTHDVLPGEWTDHWWLCGVLYMYVVERTQWINGRLWYTSGVTYMCVGQASDSR